MLPVHFCKAAKWTHVVEGVVLFKNIYWAVHLLCRILDIRVDEEWLCLAVDVFDGDLEAVEASGFRWCDFGCKVAAEILVDDAARGCEEGENMWDEVLFRRQDSIPIRSVQGQLIQRSRRRLRSSCTSSKCRCVGWRRERNNGVSLGEVAQQQGRL